jgi:hypothetical protein
VAPTTVAPTTAYADTYMEFSYRELTDKVMSTLQNDTPQTIHLDTTMTKLAQAWADYLRDNKAGNPQHSINYGRCEYIAYIPQVYPGHADVLFRSEMDAVGVYVGAGITNHVAQFETDSSITNIGIGISRSADGMFGYEDIYVVVVGASDKDLEDAEWWFEELNPEAVPYLNSPSENLSSANYN